MAPEGKWVAATSFSGLPPYLAARSWAPLATPSSPSPTPAGLIQLHTTCPFLTTQGPLTTLQCRRPLWPSFHIPMTLIPKEALLPVAREGLYLT